MQVSKQKEEGITSPLYKLKQENGMSQSRKLRRKSVTTSTNSSQALNRRILMQF